MTPAIRAIVDLELKNRKPEKQDKRFFTASLSSRLTNDWTTVNKHSDAELRFDLDVLRARCREEARNNDYLKRYFRLLEINIIGETGIVYQSKSRDDRGNLDIYDNRQLDDAWWKWGIKGNCTVDKQYSLIDFEKQVIRSVARDGEALIIIHRGFKNNHYFALQLLEADFLATAYNTTLPNGNSVRLGVEYNPYGEPVAYYLYPEHPGIDPITTIKYKDTLKRIPKENIIHFFYKERSTQGRGIPWASSCLATLRHLDKFLEAEVVASRVAAGQMGVLESPTGEGYTGDYQEDGVPELEIEPGVFRSLPQGWKMQPFTPQHPNINAGEFVKVLLRKVAAGLGVSYNSLASDLESTSYGSLRQGALEDRANWKQLHMWFIEGLMQPVFEEWLRMQLLMQTVRMPMRKIDKYLYGATWRELKFPWLDPLKDSAANEKDLNNMLTSRTRILGDQGIDIDEHLQELADEKMKMEKLGLISKPVQQQEKPEEKNLPPSA